MVSALLISLTYFLLPSDSTIYDLVIGSYTRDGNPGIEVYRYNTATGASLPLYSIKSPNASYQTFTANGEIVYSVNDESGKSFVSAYKRDSNGQYSLLNEQHNRGNGACHITYRESSASIYVANYGTGSLSVFKTEDGKILPLAQHIVYKGSGINKSRQEAPHAHQVVVSPDQHYLYVTDLGTDQIHQHTIHPDGTVSEKYADIPLKPGTGARHLTFNESGNRVYVIGELTGTVDVFSVSNDHQLKHIQRILADTSAASVKGSGHIQLSPSGKWLLTTNRITTDELTIFRVQPDGTLKKIGHQPVTKKPRMFSFDPSGKFILVAGQDGNAVQIFSFDDNTGNMRNTNQNIQQSMPVCLSFIPRFDPDIQLTKLNITLMKPSAPIANYVKYVRTGNLIYLAGHGPDKPGGGQITGKLGKDLTVEEGQNAARLTGISLLSTLKSAIGSLNKVKRIVKVNGYVQSADDFTQHPFVMNGFSNLMVDVFGEKGKHARTSIGVNTLPNHMAVEIEMIVEVEPDVKINR